MVVITEATHISDDPNTSVDHRQGPLGGSSDDRASISVVIPSYNRPQDLIRLVDSICAGIDGPELPLELVIVTCGYDEGTEKQIAETLNEHGVALNLLRLEQPIKVSGSRNLGARTAKGDLILFVDDDNEFSPETISLLAAALADVHIALAGPVMYYGDEPEKIWCAGLTRTTFLARTDWRRDLGVNPDPILPTDDLPNCFMVRAADFTSSGGFDEVSFPQSFEEADFAARLKATTEGIGVCVVAASTWHHMGTQAKHRRYHLKGPAHAYSYAHHRRQFLALHGTPMQKFVDRLGGSYLFAPAYLLAMRSAPKGDRRVLARQYFKGLRAPVRRP